MRITIVTFLVACGARTELGVGPGDGSSLDASAHDSAHDVAETTVADVILDVPLSLSCAAQSTTVLATWSMGGADIAVDDAYVYFHGDDGVARVAKGGGSVDLLTPTKIINGPIVLRATAIDWVQWSPTSTSIQALPKTNGAPTTLLTETTPGFVGLTPASGDALFFFGASIENNTVLDVTDTGVVTHTWLGAVNATDVQTSDGLIYFTVEYGHARLARHFERDDPCTALETCELRAEHSSTVYSVDLA